MNDEIRIKPVYVEFFREGPAHNQLLSPITSYFAVRGSFPPSVVRIPYEHAEFERRMKEMRYETGDSTDRQAMLHTIGRDMGKILGTVPGVPGALGSDGNVNDTLVHLRITHSASELALLPFELAKTPVSATEVAESWLAVQTRPPVCMTRNVRTVSSEGVQWPSKPRMLFISGDAANVPYEAHREKLVQVLERFRYPGSDEYKGPIDAPRQQFGDLLTILLNPTLTDIRNECVQTNYTHIHVLAHGDVDDSSRGSFGLVLRVEGNDSTVVSGDQFVKALTHVGCTIHRPSVVTMATCDSANIGTVMVPGASFAHALHHEGVPLVVASQFPLSKDGSVALIGAFYDGLLNGRNPLILLQQLRVELYMQGADQWHDWASLVVYESLPQSLTEQLDTLRYYQGRRAMNAVLERIEQAVRASVFDNAKLTVLEKQLSDVLNHLPMSGHYGVECLGLRAASYKRRASASSELLSQKKKKRGESDEKPSPARDQYILLSQALQDYVQAVEKLLTNATESVQHKATVHWVLTQVVSLNAVLGRTMDERHLHTAELSAELYCNDQNPEERAWAHGSLAELFLLRLALPSQSETERKEYRDKAIDHAKKLGAFYPWDDKFPIKSTRRQFKRYTEWWGSPEFEEGLVNGKTPGKKRWKEKGGLIDTAGRIVEILTRKGTDDSPPSGPSSPRGGAPPAGSPSPAGNPNRKSDADTETLKSRPNPTPPPRDKKTSFFRVDLLPAGHGDAIWIEYGDKHSTHRWLMDCGTHSTARELTRRVDELSESERMFELFIMSHVDSDHIGGALPFLGTIRDKMRFGDVWFNGWRHISAQLGARQGEIFSTAIQDFELPWNDAFNGEAVVVRGDDLPEVILPGGMKLTLLSPTPTQLKKLAPAWTRELKRAGLEPGTRVDYSRFLKGTPSTSTDVDQLAATQFASDAGLPNGSSIAVLAEFGGAAILLGADAHVPVLIESITKLLKKRKAKKGARLNLDALKVPHHGSQNNLSNDLLELLDCNQYLISTNGDHFCHPDRQAIARIIKHGGTRPKIFFNYLSKFNDVWKGSDMQKKYKYEAEYAAAGPDGLKISLLGA